MSNVEDIRQIQLNGEQQDTVQKLDDFIKSPNLVFRLDGPAGTGKSTTFARWAQHATSNGLQLALSAPTNKATRNLRSMKNKINPNAKIATGTAYSLLGLVLGNNNEIREIETTDMHKLEGVKVLGIDESSMINDALMQRIYNHATETNTKIILMGDPRYQLPPVGQEEPSVCKFHLNAELTKVERHDNQVLNFATYLRGCIDSKTNPMFKGDYDADGGVVVLGNRDFYRQMKKAFCSDLYDEYPDAFKTLAWRNAIVDEFNDSIRNAMYDDNPATPFEVGERIVARAPVMDVMEYKHSGQESFLATTDEEGTVISTLIQPHPVFGEIEVYAVIFENEMGDAVCGYLPTKAGQRVYQQKANQLFEEAKQNKRRWPQFWQFKGLFADLMSCHALTTHRAQGSTYRTTFVDVCDLMQNRDWLERMKLLYVASTRPSNTLILRV